MERLISVIIPVLNEAQNLDRLLSTLCGLHVLEVIVVDGGSTDRSREIAADSGAEVVQAATGRAVQLNAGAKDAAGSILYFLHADSSVPQDWDAHITHATKKGFDAGCFTMRWNEKHVSFRLLGWATRFFGPRFRGGDQSLFITKQLFEYIGGYQEMPIFEDVEIIERIRKNGKFMVIDHPVVASARRYERVGIWRLHWYYLILHTMYRIGLPINLIKKQYDTTVGRGSWN